jgi:hypothetical protein
MRGEVGDRMAQWAARGSLDKLVFELIIDSLTDLLAETVPGFTHNLWLTFDVARHHLVQRLPYCLASGFRSCPGAPYGLSQPVKSSQPVEEQFRGLRQRLGGLVSVLHYLLEEFASTISHRFVQLGTLLPYALYVVGESTSRQRQPTAPTLDLSTEPRHSRVFLLFGRLQRGELLLKSLDLALQVLAAHRAEIVT